jgi:hypothetical protein
MKLVAGNSSETWELFTNRHGVTYQNTWIVTSMIMSDLADFFNIGHILDVGRDNMEQKFYRNANLKENEDKHEGNIKLDIKRKR